MPANLATWIMILVLDVLGLILVLRAGNKSPFLQIGWTIAALLIVLAIALNNTLWQWTWIETISVSFCILSIFIWYKISAKYAIWPQMMAAYISFIPQGVDYWSLPQTQTWWLWAGTIVGCLLAIIGSKKQTFENVFIPWGCVILNATVLLILFRSYLF